MNPITEPGGQEPNSGALNGVRLLERCQGLDHRLELRLDLLASQRFVSWARTGSLSGPHGHRGVGYAYIE